MRQIGNGLQHFFVFLAAHFIEKQRQNDGSGEGNRDSQSGQGNGIPENAPEFTIAHESFKMLQAHPGTAPNTAGKGITFEGDDHARQGLVMEEQIVDDDREEHEVYNAVFTQNDTDFTVAIGR